MQQSRSSSRLVLIFAAIAGLLLLVVGPADARTSYVSYNGCAAQLYNKTAYAVGGGNVWSYSSTIRTNTISCSLGTNNKYNTTPGGTTYTTSTAWGSTEAEKYGPSLTYLVKSFHYVNYNGPIAGKWYELAK